MSRIFFDTNLFIYYIEDFGPRGKRVTQLVEAILTRGDEILTSVLTLGEVLAKPLADGNTELAEGYEAALRSPGVTILDFDRACARAFAHIRRDKTVKAPDAIQLACAAQARCDLFITNDDRLSQKIVPGIQFITSLDRAFI